MELSKVIMGIELSKIIIAYKVIKYTAIAIAIFLILAIISIFFES